MSIMTRLVPVLGLALFLHTGPAAAQDRPDLSGTWSMNMEASEHPTPQMRSGMSAAQVTRGTRAETGSRRGRPSEAPPPNPRLVQEVLNPPRRIVVEQTDSTVSLAQERGAPLVYFTDGRRMREEIGEGITLQTRAEWKGEELRVERRVPSAETTVRMTIRLDRDTGQLVVRSRLEGPGRPELRRVYDRVE